MKKVIYFAYPISLYNTPFEAVVVEDLVRRGYEVVNPGAAKYQNEYKKRRISSASEHPMLYWLELADTCDVCVFVPFPAGNHLTEGVPYSGKPQVGAGVGGEIDFFRSKGRPIYWLWPFEPTKSGEEITLLDFDGWSEFELLTVEKTRAVLHASGVKR